MSVLKMILESVNTAPIWVFAVRTVVIYFGLILATRISGRREVARLDAYSFIVAVTIGSIASPPMVDARASVITALVTILAFYFLHVIVYWLEGRVPLIAKLAGDEPLVVVENGKVVEDNLMKAHYNLDNLLTQLRIKGAPAIQDVEFAILETSGEISVVKKSQARPASRADLNLMVQGSGWPRVVVADGVINPDNLAMTGHDEQWVMDQIRSKGIDDISKVLMMMVDRGGNVYVDYIRPSQFSMAK